MPDLAPIPGDVNGDGVVNMLDVAIASKNFDRANATHAEGDVVGDPNHTGVATTSTPDGVVNGSDLAIILSNYAP